MTKGEAAVARARALIGTRFIAQGRDPAIGLDCIGLVLCAYGIERSGVPDDYQIRGAHRGAILDFAKAGFRRVSRRRVRAGDLLVLHPGAAQWHLGIWTGDAVIHADVAIRRVVERPGAPPWPVSAALRPRARPTKKG